MEFRTGIEDWSPNLFRTILCYVFPEFFSSLNTQTHLFDNALLIFDWYNRLFSKTLEDGKLEFCRVEILSFLFSSFPLCESSQLISFSINEILIKNYLALYDDIVSLQKFFIRIFLYIFRIRFIDLFAFIFQLKNIKTKYYECITS